MTGISAHPEVQFRVKSVRVSIWPSTEAQEGEKKSYKITIDRCHSKGRGAVEWTEVFLGTDIPAAILALKKSHGYLTVKKDERTGEGVFHRPQIRAPERIP